MIGVQVKLFVFAMRLSYSGRAAHVAYANQAQEPFLAGITPRSNASAGSRQR